MREQRRGNRIAMTPDERDAFLADERTCRVATITSSGAPHVSPLWFAWDGTSLWLTSIVKSQRWADIQGNNRVSVVIDAGHGFMELRGVELAGEAVTVGEVPRTGEPMPELETPERIFGEKYVGGAMVHDGRHAWLRITPDKIVSWDFRKIGG